MLQCLWPCPWAKDQGHLKCTIIPKAWTYLSPAGPPRLFRMGPTKNSYWAAPDTTTLTSAAAKYAALGFHLSWGPKSPNSLRKVQITIGGSSERRSLRQSQREKPNTELPSLCHEEGMVVLTHAVCAFFFFYHKWSICLECKFTDTKPRGSGWNKKRQGSENKAQM